MFVNMRGFCVIVAVAFTFGVWLSHTANPPIMKKVVYSSVHP